MKHRLIAAVFLSVWASMYLSVAFVQWQLDPSQWGETTRFLFVMLGFMLSICAAGLASNGELA
jgi:hypothetical protein